MYTVGAYIASTLTGMRYLDFVNSRIFKPLGVTSSTYSIKAALQTGIFTNTWSFFGRLMPLWMEKYADLSAGPGGVISNVPWFRTILNGGTNPDTNHTVISTVSPNVRAETSTVLYGLLVWFRMIIMGHDTIWHTGSAGASTAVAAALEDGFGIIALTKESCRESLWLRKCLILIFRPTTIAYCKLSVTFDVPLSNLKSSADALTRRAVPFPNGVLLTSLLHHIDSNAHISRDATPLSF
ncbi:hypothetical protein F5888DRAFT_1635665 [Russula emetica]|nr:hypothetical protein F5888DRAFT_1635665 [Russula emetica]